MYYSKPLFCFTNVMFRQHAKRSAASLCRLTGLPLLSNSKHQIFPRRGPASPLRMKSDDVSDFSHLDIEIKRTPEEIKELEEEKLIEDEVREWLKNVVIGLNLCPFAERPVREKKLRIFTVRGNDDEELLSSILIVLFLQETTPGTSIIICPECYPDDFEAFLDVVNMIEKGLLVDNDLTGTLQVAPFHPLFRFEGSDVDSVDNWTNRAPYPIFHVLREDEVERAADSLDGDASRVWKRNVGLLEALEESLGPDGVERVFTSKATAGEKAQLNDILKQHRLVMKPSPKETEN